MNERGTSPRIKINENSTYERSPTHAPITTATGTGLRHALDAPTARGAEAERHRTHDTNRAQGQEAQARRHHTRANSADRWSGKAPREGHIAPGVKAENYS